MGEFAEAAMGQLRVYGVRYDRKQVEKQLNRVPDELFQNMSGPAASTLVEELARELKRVEQRKRTPRNTVSGRNMAAAARRIGVRIQSGTGEFSYLPDEERKMMIEGCPYC